MQLTSVANNTERISLARSKEKKRKKKSITSKKNKQPFDYRWLNTEIEFFHSEVGFSEGKTNVTMHLPRMRKNHIQHDTPPNEIK